VACLAQFYPKKYPANFWLLVGCVAVYVVLSTLMTVVAAVFERDAIALTRTVPGGPPALAISTRLPRFQETYTLRIATRWVGGQAAAEPVPMLHCPALVLACSMSV
jgi:signal peptidase complex subunit 2